MTVACILCEGSRLRPKWWARDPLDRRSQPRAVLECPACGLLVSAPEGPGDVYPPGYWERIRASRPAGPGPVDPVSAGRLRRLARFGPAGRALDVGCGDGALVRALAGQGWEAAGTEVDPARVRELTREGLRVFEGPLPELDLEPGRLRLVTYFGSFEHVAAPLEELAAVRRLLAGEGRLLLQVTNAAGMDACLFRGRWSGLELPRHRYNYTPMTVSRLLARAGFRVESLRTMDDWHITHASLMNLLGRSLPASAGSRGFAGAMRVARWLTRGRFPANVLEVVAVAD
jgi:SAM-dependent methyltransferase